MVTEKRRGLQDRRAVLPRRKQDWLVTGLKYGIVVCLSTLGTLAITHLQLMAMYTRDSITRPEVIKMLDDKLQPLRDDMNSIRSAQDQNTNRSTRLETKMDNFDGKLDVMDERLNKRLDKIAREYAIRKIYIRGK